MKKGRWIPLFAGVIALLVIAGIASASQASQHKQRPLAGPFCISKKTGVVRQVGLKTPCHNGEIRKVGFAVTGLRGPAGAAGPQGPAGATGATGATGLQGLPGPQGNVGPQGPAGAQGAQGLQGVQGDQGLQGLAGVPGLSSITPVSPDQTCTAGGWLMQDWQGGLYEICNGTAGADGQPGATGPQGPQGNPGADGADGQTGPMGPQGPTGDTGAQGPIGPQGPQGDPGATGSQGPAGTTAIYNASGTSQTNAHIVEGTATTNNGGNASVTFAGAAVFSSATSYMCTVTAESNGSPVASGSHISSKTTTGFSFKSTLTNTTFDYICVGN